MSPNILNECILLLLNYIKNDIQRSTYNELK